MGADLTWNLVLFHAVNYALAVVMYTLLGRFLLGFMVPPDSPNYIWRFFRRLTDWAIAAVAYVTPGRANPLLLAPVAAFWFFLLRGAFYVAMATMGLAPRLEGP
jgi:YggT family protein